MTEEVLHSSELVNSAVTQKGNGRGHTSHLACQMELARLSPEEFSPSDGASRTSLPQR